MADNPEMLKPGAWPTTGTEQIPYWVYTDGAVYKKELERFFYSGHWCYIGLEAEIPNPGDFKRTNVGERSVVATRGTDGEVYIVENVCAHRGVQFCRRRFGNAKEYICPYHQWNFDLQGNLIGVPLRRGVKEDGKVKGGMPPDFDPKQYGLTRLNVTRRNGVIFASFDMNMPSLEDYLGLSILGYFDRVFDGRTLTVLGYSRQRVPANWKLIQENIKDPYHAGLLHTWFVTFGIWRADNKSEMKMDSRGRHAAMISRKGSSGKSDVTAGVSSFKENMRLNDSRFLDVVHEPWWGKPTAVMLTLFPSLVVQQQVNSVSTRQIQPHGQNAFDYVWTHFGFAEDTEEMTRRRLRQANLFGPAGFVSADDSEVVEFSQKGFEQTPTNASVVQLGGREVADADHMVTETLIRGMYKYWRDVMEAE